MAGDPVAGHVVVIRLLVSAWLGSVAFSVALIVDCQVSSVACCVRLSELAELRDGLLVALHAQVEQAQTRLDRGILGAEGRLEDRLALGGPGAQEVPAEAVRLIEVGARGLDRGLGILGVGAGCLCGDPGGFSDGCGR